MAGFIMCDVAEKKDYVEIRLNEDENGDRYAD
jgi:hypothetical protein